MEIKLKQLIKEGEHQQQDFKHCIDDQKKIARTLVAFANTNGGRLLIGVKDNGKVVGILPEEEFHMIEGAANMYCKPNVKFESKLWLEGPKYVLEILVKENPSKEHKALDENGEWKAYFRNKDQTLLASKILLKIWNLERKGSSKPLEFGSDEQLFLAVFKTKPSFTLSNLYRNVPLAKQKIDFFVAQFVYWKVINMNISSEGTFYSII